MLATLLPLTSLLFCASHAVPWTENAQIREAAEKRIPIPMSDFEVMNLDLPPEQRWKDIAEKYKEYGPGLVKYFEEFVPKWAMPFLNKIGQDLEGYFGDYGLEMKGAADAMGISEGTVVLLNMAYQLEALGRNCSNWNTTGPTGTCKPKLDGPPGLCTSIVSNGPDGTIYHGRNLDWDLDAYIRPLVKNIHYQRGGKTVFMGSGVIGYSGLFNGVKPNGYSVSVNARNHGGNLFVNMMDMLFEGGMDPTMKVRHTFENVDTFDDAIAALQTGKLIDDMYYIVGGVKTDEGAIISRARNKAADVWKLDSSSSLGWFRLQTNYDHWKDVPSADNRRDPGNKNMESLSYAAMSLDNLYENVLTVWPTHNNHTDITALMSAAHGNLTSFLWDVPK